MDNYIGYNIKFYREKSKLTQTELADKINKNIRTLQKYEKGDIAPTFNIIKKIAEILGVSPYDIVRNTKAPKEAVTPIDTDIKKEMVNHPAHYNRGKYETIDVIEDWGLNFNLGNAIKYISRAGYKDDVIQELKKARWYIDREIQRLEGEISCK